MKETLQLAYPPLLEKEAENVKEVLSKASYPLIEVQKEFNPDLVTLVFLSPKVSAEDLFQAFPWLKEQYSRSGERYLRLLPFFAYHPKSEDAEKLFEGPLGETYEEVFSGEFKPYGWDLDDSNTLKEFERVLEETYSE